MNQPVILFDGVCNFCNSTVNYIIDKDVIGIFRFSSLQSEFGQKILKENNRPVNNFHSIYLITDGHLYERSDAVIAIIKHLKWIWPLSYLLKICPKFLRDKSYDFISKNRYKLPGKSGECRVPSPEVRKRFIY